MNQQPRGPVSVHIYLCRTHSGEAKSYIYNIVRLSSIEAKKAECEIRCWPAVKCIYGTQMRITDAQIILHTKSQRVNFCFINFLLKDITLYTVFIYISKLTQKRIKFCRHGHKVCKLFAWCLEKRKIKKMRSKF